MTLYEELKNSLEGAIEAHKQGKPLRTTTINIPDVRHYSAKEIQRIRTECGLTQKMLASFMGLSPKTIEAWERGVNKPTGPACRLLTMLEEKSVVLVRSSR